MNRRGNSSDRNPNSGKIEKKVPSLADEKIEGGILREDPSVAGRGKLPKDLNSGIKREDPGTAFRTELPEDLSKSEIKSTGALPKVRTVLSKLKKK